MYKAIAKISQNVRIDVENSMIKNDEVYYLKRSYAVKKLSPCSTKIIVKLKIREKDHNQIINTELFKKSNIEIKKII